MTKIDFGDLKAVEIDYNTQLICKIGDEIVKFWPVDAVDKIRVLYGLSNYESKRIYEEACKLANKRSRYNPTLNDLDEVLEKFSLPAIYFDYDKGLLVDQTTSNQDAIKDKRTQSIFCSQCGGELNVDDNYCGECGLKVIEHQTNISERNLEVEQEIETNYDEDAPIHAEEHLEMGQEIEPDYEEEEETPIHDEENLEMEQDIESEYEEDAAIYEEEHLEVDQEIKSESDIQKNDAAYDHIKRQNWKSYLTHKEREFLNTSPGSFFENYESFNKRFTLHEKYKNKQTQKIENNDAAYKFINPSDSQEYEKEAVYSKEFEKESIKEKLAELKDLYDNDLVNEEEYAALKKKLLGL